MRLTTRRAGGADLILQQARRAAGIVQNLLAFSRPAAAGEHEDRGGRDRGSGAARAADVTGRARHSREVRSATGSAAGPGRCAPSVASVHESDHKCRAIDRGCARQRNDRAFRSRGRGTIFASLSRTTARAFLRRIWGRSSTRFSRRSGPEAEAASALRFALRWSRNTAEESKSSQRPSTAPPFMCCCRLRRALPAPRPAMLLPPQRHRRYSGGDPLAGHTVLIVDDEEGIREIVQEGPNARGMKAEAVESAEAALALPQIEHVRRDRLRLQSPGD